MQVRISYGPEWNRRDVTGQLPLAISQLLIKRTPSRATSRDNMMVMALFLHAHTNNNRVPSSFSDISSEAPPGPFPFPVLLFTLDAQLFERLEGYVLASKSTDLAEARLAGWGPIPYAHHGRIRRVSSGVDAFGRK